MRIFQDFLANNCVYIQYNRFITFLREAFSYQSCQGLEKLLLFVDGPLRSSSSPCHQFILFLIISTTNFIGKFSLNVSISQTLLLAIINVHLPYLAQRFYKKIYKAETLWQVFVLAIIAFREATIIKLYYIREKLIHEQVLVVMYRKHS